MPGNRGKQVLEVEHFADKDTYKDRVLEWENLLPACKRCNVRKHSHDVLLDPIVNPAVDDPRDHLHFAFYRFDGKCEVGRSTVEVLGLNDPERLLLNRFQVGSKVLEVLADIGQRLREYDNVSSSVRKRNNILGRLTSLMSEGQPTAEYSATVSTVIIRSADYSFIVQEMNRLELWTDEFSQLDRGMHGIAYPS